MCEHLGLGCLVGVTLSVMVTTSPASGQTSRLPAGTALLTKMQAAMTQAGSAHVTIHTATRPIPPHVTLQASFQGFMDISSREQKVHMLVISTTRTIVGKRVTVRERFEMVAAHHLLAERQDSQMWGCSPLAPQDQDQVVTYTPYLPSKPASVATMGAGSLQGTSVWWVRVAFQPNATTMGPIDLAIAQDSLRLVEEKLRFGIPGANPGRVIMVLDYSAYGQPVSIQLPAACTASGV